ncbi:hypothetical protein SAMD00019534_034280 [Acytostelium subglobosum LB1]|uniref:hypothetical protein n=1 Tax=Acytostelium subglobosum LB1 TaxID=1410327 RepID=UPI000645063E|nr:hypothetical protein SAMD00019534_034280 [Acytostelium subglobosum LB1]GAM20253.1 hypothetical protein SAMD00019534_034280 [Acytostelium subglobosum LB1]|eukprot:XP_012759774.1 hypothetical protein SAMD00019534_034280 [Acytostelium subglobosum LB1]
MSSRDYRDRGDRGDRERDRGDRGDRDRGDRGDRSDRDRGDRGDRSDRDRGDRGDRDSRGDRSDRGDRGGDRDRDSRGGGDRDRDSRGDRGDRSDRGGGGDRDRGGYRKRSRSPPHHRNSNSNNNGYQQQQQQQMVPPPQQQMLPQQQQQFNPQFMQQQQQPNMYGQQQMQQPQFYQQQQQQQQFAPPHMQPQQQHLQQQSQPRARKGSLWDRQPDPNETIVPIGQVYVSQALQEQHPEYVVANQIPTQPSHPVNQSTSYLGVAGHSTAAAATAAASTLTLAQKQSRRLYIGNVPPNTSDAQLAEFLNIALHEANLVVIGGGPPVVSCQVSPKLFAFVEFRFGEDATAALSLDGITLNGFSLKIRRPKDYQASVEGGLAPPPVPVPHAANLSIISTNVPDGENKIFVGGIPSSLSEDQIKTLMSSIGRLRAFNLVKDKNGVSKGFAFCEYMDHANTERACNELNGAMFGDRALVVQISSGGRGPPQQQQQQQQQPLQDNPYAQSTPNKYGGKYESATSTLLNLNLPIPQVIGLVRSSVQTDDNTTPSRVIQLFNMCDKDEIQDDANYENLLIDTMEVSEEYGQVESIFVSRPKDNPLDIVRVFVKFVELDAAQRAWANLGGRKYNFRTVVSAYYPEDQYTSEGVVDKPQQHNQQHQQQHHRSEYDMEL